MDFSIRLNEDEYDVIIANEAYEEYLKDGKQSRPIQELWDEMGLSFKEGV